MPIFRYPFFYNNYYGSYYNRPYPSRQNYFPKSANYNNSQPLHNNEFSSSVSNDSPSNTNHNTYDSENKKNNSKNTETTSDYFFELFGLKLYFDDVLLICLIFFLYQEGVRDDELFISLILLLLS